MFSCPLEEVSEELNKGSTNGIKNVRKNEVLCSTGKCDQFDQFGCTRTGRLL